MAPAGALALALLLAAGCSRRQTVESFPESFAGVGLELRAAGDGFDVVRTLPGGAADVAGVAPGDRVVAIDGESTRGKALGDVVMALRGVPGSQVSLSVLRGAQRIIFVVHRQAMVKRGRAYEAADARDP